MSGLKVRIIVINTWHSIRSPQKCSLPRSPILQKRTLGLREVKCHRSHPSKAGMRWKARKYSKEVREKCSGLSSALISRGILNNLTSQALRYLSVKWRTDLILYGLPSFWHWGNVAHFFVQQSPSPWPTMLCVPGEATAWAPKSDRSTKKIYLNGTVQRLWASTIPLRTTQGGGGEDPQNVGSFTVFRTVDCRHKATWPSKS